MISAISGYNPSTYGIYGSYYANRAAQTLGANKAAQGGQGGQSGVVTTARKVHQPETPVQPVTPVRAVSEEDPAQAGLLRFGSDPAEMSVRMRIEYPGGNAAAANEEAVSAALTLPGANGEVTPVLYLPGANDDTTPGLTLPGTNGEGSPVLAGVNEDAVSAALTLPGANGEVAPVLYLPGAAAEKIDGDFRQVVTNPITDEAKSAREVMEEAECQTCKERKYQDGSDDPGVSFKTPTNIAPEQAASAVRGHENEHVVREQAKAQREDRKVVSQSVTYHTSICPECGKVYVSGGSTRTVTKADNSQQADEQNQNEDQRNPRIATFPLA